MDDRERLAGLDEEHGDLPDILTAKELEAYLRIDVKTIYAYVQRGLMPHIRIQSNLRFRKRDILEWMEERTFRPQPRNGGARSHGRRNCR